MTNTTKTFAAPGTIIGRTNRAEGRVKTVEVLEMFTFVDGVRLAWVTWLLGDGERRAISVRELAR